MARRWREAATRAAVETGWALGDELARSCELVVLGEIGIGNTTAASALLAALTGLPPTAVCGRGTGLDAQGLERKRAAVAAAPARERSRPAMTRSAAWRRSAASSSPRSPARCLRPRPRDGARSCSTASRSGSPRSPPAARRRRCATTCSRDTVRPSPPTRLVLTELGLEPLLDLRLRLGEASGAALAVPLIALAARLHAEMGRFAETGVDGPARA